MVVGLAGCTVVVFCLTTVWLPRAFCVSQSRCNLSPRIFAWISQSRRLNLRRFEIGDWQSYYGRPESASFEPQYRGFLGRRNGRGACCLSSCLAAMIWIEESNGSILENLELGLVKEFALFERLSCCVLLRTKLFRSLTVGK
jgi:hypothetical protein